MPCRTLRKRGTNKTRKICKNPGIRRHRGPGKTGKRLA